MTTTAVNALLVDDQAKSEYVQGVINSAGSLGLQIRPVEPQDLVQAVSEYSPQVLIMDAKMKVSARKLARSAVKQRAELAIFFWTEFPSDADLEDLGTSLNPLIKCGVGMKAPKADTSTKILNESLVVPLQTLLERPGASDLWPLREQPPAQSAIFSMTVDEFNEKPLSLARELLTEGHQEASELIHHVFSSSDAEWLLLAGPEMDIIRWGATLANKPDSRRIFELGHRFGFLPLLFTRPLEVEDIDSLNRSRAWAECPPADFYPSLGIDFTGAASVGTRQIHFDTGAVRTFLSLDQLESVGALDEIHPIDLRPGERGSHKFQYVDKDVRIVLSDGGEAAALNIKAVVVFDWDQSPFAKLCRHGQCPGSRQIGPRSNWTCGRREVGLLGRDVLIEGRLRVVLDGVERKTRFLREEDEGLRPSRRPWRDG